MLHGGGKKRSGKGRSKPVKLSAANFIRIEKERKNKEHKKNINRRMNNIKTNQNSLLNKLKLINLETKVDELVDQYNRSKLEIEGYSDFLNNNKILTEENKESFQKNISTFKNKLVEIKQLLDGLPKKIEEMRIKKMITDLNQQVAENPSEIIIDNANLFFCKLKFEGQPLRKYLFIGERHKMRNNSDYLAYFNLVNIPVQKAKSQRVCLDLFIEDLIRKKKILNNYYSEQEFANLSLKKLIGNLKIIKNEYLRIHNFDTREHYEKNGLFLDRSILVIFISLCKNKYENVHTIIKEILNGQIVKEKLRELFFINDDGSISKEKKAIFVKSLFKGIHLYSEDVNNNTYLSLMKKNRQYFETVGSEITDFVFNQKFIDNFLEITCESLSNISRRIEKEYSKIPQSIKDQYKITPIHLYDNIYHKHLFMTDIYLFYRILMNYGKPTKIYNGPCGNAADKSLLIAGAAHIDNIINLFNNSFHEIIEIPPDFINQNSMKAIKNFNLSTYIEIVNDLLFGV